MFHLAHPGEFQLNGLFLRFLVFHTNGVDRGIYNPDKNNFAPRIGIAYTLMPKTVVRTGYALHYIPVVGSVDPVGYSTTTSMVTSIDGFTPRDRLSNPFPSGLAASTGNSQGLATLVGNNISFVDPTDVTPLLHTWNINIQREVFSKSLLQVGYVGSHGVHITSDPQTGISENINQVPSQFLSMGSALLESVPNPFAGIIKSGQLSGSTVQRQQLLRPFPQYLNITRNLPTFGSTVYHSLQTKFEQRLWHGLTTIVSHTFAKNIGDNQLLGSFILEGIAPARRMEPKIEVAFRIDENGILAVDARDAESGAQQGIRIEDPLGLQQVEPAPTADAAAASEKTPDAESRFEIER